MLQVTNCHTEACSPGISSRNTTPSRIQRQSNSASTRYAQHFGSHVRTNGRTGRTRRTILLHPDALGLILNLLVEGSQLILMISGKANHTGNGRGETRSAGSGSVGAIPLHGQLPPPYSAWMTRMPRLSRMCTRLLLFHDDLLQENRRATEKTPEPVKSRRGEDRPPKPLPHSPATLQQVRGNSPTSLCSFPPAFPF